MNAKLKYRPDIDGLRAVAVLAVLFYHAGLGVFSGGYVGVDVFFVISGYLITKKIANEIQANSFSLARFYERRIRRIFPALFTVIIFTLLIGAWLFDAGSFLELGKSAVATTLFRSNIHFWNQAGYFERPSTLKPLLHMWSLSVEEQFYFFLPLLMILLFRFFSKRLVTVLAVLCGVIFSFNILVLNQDPSAAFFFAQLRAWELLIGSIIALKSVKLKPHYYNILAWLGMIMILLSVVLYSDATAFPGIAAGVPVIGASLIIYSGIFGKSFIGKILSTRPFVFIGKISYSLYLWHWPFLVFTKYYLIRELTALEILVWVAVTFGTSVLSWKWIETPFRAKTFLKRDQIFKLAASVMGFTLIFGYAINHYDGFPSRFEAPQAIKAQDTGNLIKESHLDVDPTPGTLPPDSDNIKKEPPADTEPTKDVVFPYSDWNFEWLKWKNCSRQKEDISAIQHLKFCILGDSAKQPTFIVWGDSHANAFATAINIAAADSGESGYIFAKHGCLPLLGIDRDNQFRGQCYKFNNVVIQYLKKHPEIKTVILVGRWSVYADGSRYKEEEGDPITL
ncbi:MAG: acyltransferase family protein, partial [Chloroflexota bacterium]